MTLSRRLPFAALRVGGTDQWVRPYMSWELDAAGVLDWLQGHAAHARLLQGVVDGLADLVVVESLLQRYDQIRRDVIAV